jgi:integrase
MPVRAARSSMRGLIHVTLQKALSQAVRDDLIPRNVASGERPRSSRHQKEAMALSPTQVRALLAEARGERNEAIYIAAIHTGLRKGELLGLKWTDLDLDGGTLCAPLAQGDGPRASLRSHEEQSQP